MKTRMTPAVVVVGVGLIVIAAPVDARQAVSPSTAPPVLEALSAAERYSAVNGALARVSDPTMRSAASGPTPTFLLEAGSTSKIASARVGFQIRDLLVDVKLQGQVDSSSGQAVLADLGGLRNKSTAEFGLLWARYPQLVSRRLLEEACATYEAVSRQAIRTAACTATQLRAAGPESTSPTAGASPQARLIDNVVRLLEPRRLFVAGLSYKVGPERFTFTPTATGNAIGESRVNWSVSARAGLVTSATLAIGAEYAHEVDYDAGEKRQICVPKGDGILECFDRVTGGPTRRHREIARVELRKFIGSKFAINPRVSVNMNSATVGFEVPVYFLQSDKGGLAGGVTLGWRHSHAAGSALEITAFVSQVFGLILR